MSLDLVNEHDAMLSKCGSFWYGTVNRRDRDIAHTINGMACHTNAVEKLADISEATLSGGYFAGHNKVLRFNDGDISYNGADKALQALYNGGVQADGTLLIDKITSLAGDGAAQETRELPYIQPHKTGFGWDDYDKSASPAASGKIKITESGHLFLWGTHHYGWCCMRGIHELDPNSTTNYNNWAVNEYATESIILDFDKPVKIKSLAYSSFVGLPGWGLAPFTIALYKDSVAEENLLVSHTDPVPSTIPGGQRWFDTEGVDVPEPGFYDRYAVSISASQGRRGHAIISDLKFDATYKDNSVPLADEKRLPVMFPSNEGVNTDLVLPANYRALFCLKVDDDIRVTTIDAPDGGILVDGTDFVSEFGRLWLQNNPVALFPDMKLMARSYVRRTRNLYCYPLRLDNIYGPVDRVMAYYREVQSPAAFKLAAAQACGLAVTRKACRVTWCEPLLSGWSYYTLGGGRLDAPYPHNKIVTNTVLPAGHIIGGGELFDMVLPGDTVAAMDSIDTSTALPDGMVVPDKTICAKCVVGGIEYDRPVDCEPGGVPEDGNALFAGYWKWMAECDGGPDEWEDGMEAVDPMNGIDWVRQVACHGNALVVRINHGFMPYDMQVKLHNFILREAPIGCLLTYSPITSTILED